LYTSVSEYILKVSYLALSKILPRVIEHSPRQSSAGIIDLNNE